MSKALIAICLPLLLLAFKEGEYFTPAVFVDQFDQNVTITRDDNSLIVVFDKAGYYDVNAFVKRQGKGYLQKRKIKYLNDISAMPESILKFFVRPRMQTLTYPVLLVKEENVSQMLDYREGMITLYRLEKGRIREIKFVRSDELENALQ